MAGSESENEQDQGVGHMKKCPKCGLMVPVDAFYKNQYQCKKCDVIYRQAHKEKKAANNVVYYQANKAKLAARIKAYYQANKAKLAAKQQAYRKANKDKIETRLRARLKTDKDFAVKRRLSPVITCALRRQFTEKAHKTKDLLGCDYATFRRHFERKFTKGMTWEAFMRGEIHIDHIMPCSKFNLADPAQQRSCFHYKNLQPLWAADNLSKSDRLLEPTQIMLGI